MSCNFTQAQFARLIGVSAMRISHIVNGNRPVTAELALLFGRAFGQSPQYWLNLQSAYDLKLAEAAHRLEIAGNRRDHQNTHTNPSTSKIVFR